MEDKPLISLIIPVYNVEKYFDKCMESVLAQTYKNFEAILVDDGSTDSSGRMCDEYAKRNSRVNVIHQRNFGVSKARNIGIDVAKGEWISFIDGDDVIHESYLEKLIRAQKETDCDWIACEFTNISEDGKKEERRITFDESCKFTGDDIKRYVVPKILVNFQKQMLGNPVCKLFRREIIATNKIKYCEEIRLNEDRLFNYEYSQYIRSFAYIAESLYTRAVRRDSSMNVFRENLFDEYSKVLQEYCRQYRKYGVDKKTDSGYIATLLYSDPLRLNVCHVDNPNSHEKRWREYYKFLSATPSKEMRKRMTVHMYWKESIKVVLVECHLTHVADYIYRYKSK